MTNPAPRANIVSALLHPQNFRDTYAQLSSSIVQGRSPAMITGLTSSRNNQDHRTALQDDLDEDEDIRTLWELPDTSILFRGYVEAGKMVNVYDWFQSFASVLDAQRYQQRMQSSSMPHSPSKNGINGGRAGRGLEDADADAEVEGEDCDEDEEDEAWRAEVQARFMRALHELDYMGFIKHTGRKADHIIRTIYDIPD